MRSVTLIFLIAASGAWWLEHRLAADAASAGDAAVVAPAQAIPDATAQDDAANAPVEEDATGDDAAGGAAQPIEELTAEEIEAEIRRAQEVLDDPDAPEEFVQSRPLPADIAIDLPSDI